MAEKKKSENARNWLFTLHNYTEEDFEHYQDLADNYDKIKMFVFGKEICPKTGTPHLQGFIGMKSPCGIVAIKKLLHYEFNESRETWAHFAPRQRIHDGGGDPTKAGLRKALGTIEENVAYCCKGICSSEEFKN